ncbi:MAG: hypothetical protein WC000_09035, partial [Dokdonella sp.]
MAKHSDSSPGISPGAGRHAAHHLPWRARTRAAMYHSRFQRIRADFMSKQTNALCWLLLSVLIIVADQV